MKKINSVAARNAKELASALGLTPADGAEIELRSELNSKIVEIVARKKLTHGELARLAKTSRTRVYGETEDQEGGLKRRSVETRVVE